MEKLGGVMLGFEIS